MTSTRKGFISGLDHEKKFMIFSEEEVVTSVPRLLNIEIKNN